MFAFIYSNKVSCTMKGPALGEPCNTCENCRHWEEFQGKVCRRSGKREHAAATGMPVWTGVITAEPLYHQYNILGFIYKDKQLRQSKT